MSVLQTFFDGPLGHRSDKILCQSPTCQCTPSLVMTSHRTHWISYVAIGNCLIFMLKIKDHGKATADQSIAEFFFCFFFLMIPHVYVQICVLYQLIVMIFVCLLTPSLCILCFAGQFSSGKGKI